MLTGASAYSQLQQIKIVSFTVKNQLPAVIDSWGTIPGSLLLVAQLPPNVSVKGIRLMVQIKSNGAIVCGNNSVGGMQVDEFTTRTFSANELTGTLQGCHDLKEGSYSICVQFYNVDRVAISNEVCKEFSVEAQNIEYTPPTLINPENGKVFTEIELSRPVNFRWTPCLPKPQGPVTYRLKVWQLMQGQNGTQAMRTNQPIVTKDVDNITQAVVNSIITGPCKPPYMCDFIWAVQALNREGKPIGKNEGTSDPYTFKVETNTANYTAPQLISPNEGKAYGQNEMSAPVFFRWTPCLPKPQGPVTYRLKVWQLMQGQTPSQAIRTNTPIVTKDVDNITQAAVTGIYTGPCKPPYMCDFVWQVQAVDREDHPIGSNEGKSEVWAFKVTENGVTACTPPKLSTPADAKSFLPKDMSAPVLFRWTPLVPKPRDPVTYRLKVWQLMQGQNGQQAMRTNKPYIEKEMVDVTETSVANLYTGPCKPPYLCDFVWQVQALTREGKPACATNEGKSEPYTFKILDDNINTKIDSVKVGCCEKGKQTIYVKVANLHPTNQAQVTAIKYRVNGTGPLTTLSPTSPAIPFTIPANSSQAFTATINCVDSMKTMKFIVETNWPTDPDNINNETAWDTLKCACTACDEKNFIFTAPVPGNILVKNGAISFNQPVTISAPGKTVSAIKAELVYFEMVPENDLCIPCNKDAATYGHFNNGTNSQEWTKPIPQQLNINLTTPLLTPCCSALFKWCIRYVVEMKDSKDVCYTCNVLVCYEKKKEGCEKSAGNTNPNNDKK